MLQHLRVPRVVGMGEETERGCVIVSAADDANSYSHPESRERPDAGVNDVDESGRGIANIQSRMQLRPIIDHSGR